MQKDNLDKRFAGSVRLVTWHLWRVGESTDLDACFAKAIEAGMLSADDEGLVRECIECEERMRRGEDSSLELTEELVHTLHMCAIKLNTADSA